jgi:hypothetical protein
MSTRFESGADRSIREGAMRAADEPGHSAIPADAGSIGWGADSWESPCACPDDCLRDHQLD